MARQPSATDFFVTVKGAGDFRFGRRTYGDKFRIKRALDDHLREFSGADEDPEAVAASAAMAAYGVLMVTCPAGWERLDCLELSTDPGIESKLWEVIGAWQAAEDDFRRRANGDSQARGQGAGADLPVLVPPQIQPESP